jgi:hypothetical protein
MIYIDPKQQHGVERRRQDLEAVIAKGLWPA